MAEHPIHMVHDVTFLTVLTRVIYIICISRKPLPVVGVPHTRWTWKRYACFRPSDIKPRVRRVSSRLVETTFGTDTGSDFSHCWPLVLHNGA
jgi:hypothetical protein